MPSPGRDVPVIAALTNLGAFLDPKSLLEEKLGAELASALDLQRPFDALMFKGLKDDPQFVVSVGVEDVPAFAAHTAKELSLVRLSPGRFRVKKVSAGDEPFKCEVWQGVSAVGARLICAGSEQLIELCGAFLVSPERVNAKTPNVHFEIPHEAIAHVMRDLGKQEKVEGPTKTPEQLGREEAMALFDAVQSMATDVTLQEKSVEVSMQVEMKPSNSLFASLVAGKPGPHPLVANAFWNLPPDSDLALYGEGVDEQALRDAWRKVAPQIYAFGIDEKAAKPGQMEDFSRLVESAFIRAGRWELAYGQDLNASANTIDGAAGKLKDKPSKASAPADLVRANQQVSGWTVLGLEIGDRDAIAAVRAAIAAGNKIPSRKDTHADAEDRTNTKDQEKPLKHPEKLPKGAVHLFEQVIPNKKYVAKEGHPAALPSTFHVVAVQQSGQLWVSIANDEDTAVQRLSQVLAPDTQQSLGGDTELKALAITPPSAIGFATIEGVVALGLSLDTIEELESAQKSLQNLLSSPHKGGTRMPIWVTADGTSTRRIALHVKLPADAIADMLHLSVSELAGDR